MCFVCHCQLACSGSHGHDIKLSESQQHILRHLDFHPTAFDDIVERTQLTSGDVASDLLIMELAGVIEKLPGANYQKI